MIHDTKNASFRCSIGIATATVCRGCFALSSASTSRLVSIAALGAFCEFGGNGTRPLRVGGDDHRELLVAMARRSQGNKCGWRKAELDGRDHGR